MLALFRHFTAVPSTRLRPILNRRPVISTLIYNYPPIYSSFRLKRKRNGEISTDYPRPSQPRRVVRFSL